MSEYSISLGGERRIEVLEDDVPVVKTRFVLTMDGYSFSDGAFRTSEANVTFNGVELGVVHTIRHDVPPSEYYRFLDNGVETLRLVRTEGHITLEVDMSEGVMATLNIPQSQITIFYNRD